MPALIDPLWTPVMLPVAPFTRTLHVVLPWNVAESGRYAIQWNWSVDIVGILFTVINNSDNAPGGTIRVPTHADLVCSLQVSNEKQYTATDDNSDVAAFADFADLRALDVVAGFRNARIIIAGPGELGFNFRWKRGVLATQQWLDGLISASVFYRRCSMQEAREGIAKMTEYSR